MFLLDWTGMPGKVQWIVSDNGNSSQQNLPRIRLYDCSFFPDIFSIEFKLSGLMSLIRCEFKHPSAYHPSAYLTLEKSWYEQEITEETLRNFKSRDDQNRIEIIQTKIDVRYIHIYINNAARRLKM